MSTVTTTLRTRAGSEPFLDHYADDGRTSYTWEEFWSLVAGYKRLIDRDLPEVRFLLIIGRTTPATIASFFAAIAAGCTVSFFPPPHPRQDSAYYQRQQTASLSKVGADAIVLFDVASVSLEMTDRCRVVRFPPAAELQLSLQDGQHCLSAFIDRFGNTSDPTRPLFVQHSSGTTGIKKAVSITARQLETQLNSYWHGVVEPQLAADPVVASWLPLYHDMGLVATLLLPTLAGRRIGFVDAFDWVARPQLFLDLIADRSANICWMPNFAFRHYCRLWPALRRVDLSSMRLWVDCSEPCRTRDASEFESRFGAWGVGRNSVVGSYAMAETVFAVSQAEPGSRRTLFIPPNIRPGDPIAPTALLRDSAPEVASDHAAAILSSGKPVPDARVRCFVGGDPVREGIYGEIGVAAPFLFGGYRGMTSVESGIRRDGYYLTGDLGVLLHGELFVFGRKKEMIIINGKNLFASDIEAVIGSVPGIKPGRIVAFGIDSETTGSEELVIVAEKDEGTDERASKVINNINRILHAEFLISAKDVVLSEERWLVKSTSGKISRSDNKLKYLEMAKSTPERETVRG